MKIRFGILSLVCLLAASCSVQDFDTLDVSSFGNDNIYASLESYSEFDTRVYVDEDIKMLWDAEDQISIFNNTTLNQQYTFMGETGDNAGFFAKVSTPNGTGDPIGFKCAVYPYQSSTKIDKSGVLTLTLPGEQAYRENSFDRSANAMVSTTDDNLLTFRNVGGFLVLKFYGEGISVSSIKLEGNNGELLSGEATLTPVVGANPTIAMASPAGSSITLFCETPVKLGATKDDATVFWLVVPPTSFSKGFTLTVTDALGAVFVKKTTKSFSIPRNKVLRISPIEVVLNNDNVFIPFEDDIFKAYCVENFDTNGDKRVSATEAKNVTSIYVNNKQITSLSGIKYFRNLTTLECKFNQLTDLDVSGCTELETLNCYNNQLTSLSVDNCPALKSLFCKSNRLTSLDVSGSLALESINCADNQLSGLDVSNNAMLVTLYCHINQLTSLDVSNNALLSTLYCYSNPSLSEIWISPGQTIANMYYDFGNTSVVEVRGD